MNIDQKVNILIIGGDSYIAKNFIYKFSDCFNIRIISRKITGYWNELIIEDFNNIPEIEFRKKNVVINFAAIVHINENKIIKKNYYDINVSLAIKNANQSKHAGVYQFVQISTIAVYGDVEKININSRENPKTIYAKSKLIADKEILNLNSTSFKVAIVRPPMVYGGGNTPGNMMRLITLVSSGIPLPFRGFENKRNFINVNNLIQYIAIIVEKELDGIYLVSDNVPVSTEYIIHVISKHLQKEIKTFKIPQFALDLLKFIRPKIYNKLYRALEISTNFPFEYSIQNHSVDEGILEMVDWYHKERFAGRSSFL
jgi:UDP-glucose 4-epimerase